MPQFVLWENGEHALKNRVLGIFTSEMVHSKWGRNYLGSCRPLERLIQVKGEVRVETQK